MRKILFIIISVVLTFNLYSQKEHYVVVLEGTGTWCGACPRGIIILEEFSTTDSMFFIPICVHEPVSQNPVDPMVPEGLPYSNSDYYFNAFPSFMFEGLDEVDAGPSVENGVQNLTTSFNQRRAMHPPLSVAVSSEYNESTRETAIHVSTNLGEDLSGDYRFNVVIVEDSVTGTTSEYDQTNYYANGGLNPCGRFSTLPDPVPAAEMVYPHVARKFFGGKFGVENSLPNNLVAGETYDYDFSYTVPDNYNVNKITIVAWVSTAYGRIINANYQDLIHESTSVDDFQQSNIQAVIYPNPSKGIITLENTKGLNNISIDIFDLTGKLILSKNKLNLKTDFTIDLSNQKSGVYLCKIKTNDNLIIKKIVLSK